LFSFKASSAISLGESFLPKYFFANLSNPLAETSPVSVINFNGGTMSDGNYGTSAGGDYNWLRAGTSNLILSGGVIFEVNNSNGREITEPILHTPFLGATVDGGLKKTGAQILTLSANNNYTGPTVVESGALCVNGDISESSLQHTEECLSVLDRNNDIELRCLNIEDEIDTNCHSFDSVVISEQTLTGSSEIYIKAQPYVQIDSVAYSTTLRNANLNIPAKKVTAGLVYTTEGKTDTIKLERIITSVNVN